MMNVAMYDGLRYIARCNRIWIRQPRKLRWIACYKTELDVTFRETKALA